VNGFAENLIFEEFKKRKRVQGSFSISLMIDKRNRGDGRIIIKGSCGV